ncbi:alpha/beta fold hydrolase [Kibdelosporangium phytohabitans]|uniref:Hydrolase n=1 Tax=Kibdelosporangium phytohabitans TaxID=860235 RepID=A0A0N9I292_9PSEU|nr:alpha/beta fold hydrolase [Kibdelosporangium phytohabitans]ALG09794.1 hydrolase [Kibdelosporangium phytohabitans]MBE1468829.1 pimeloyl-ACP methyl ester carboxylesterase [Kibdelosporangium phytohabitans]
MPLPVTHTQPAGPTAGPPVVLVHGFASAGTKDWPAARWAEPLAEAGRETFVVHLPGHQGGPAADDAEDVTTPNVLRRLAASVPSGQVDLVGYSLGARLAWDLAATKALEVRRLVLGGLSPMEPFAMVDLAAARSSVHGGPSPVDPLTAAIAGMVRDQDANSLLNLVEGLARQPFDPAASVPRVPTLLLAGENDQMSQGIERIAALVPDAQLRHVPGDHLGALASDEFRAAVLEFLGV